MLQPGGLRAGRRGHAADGGRRWARPAPHPSPSARPFTPTLTLTRSPWAEAGGAAEKAALYRLGISPHIGAQPERSLADGDVPALDRLSSPAAADSRAIPPLGGRPMARSMSLDSSLLGGTPLLGGARPLSIPPPDPPCKKAFGPAEKYTKINNPNS